MDGWIVWVMKFTNEKNKQKTQIKMARIDLIKLKNSKIMMRAHRKVKRYQKKILARVKMRINSMIK